jgi:RND family efflux transporter MFP subunit
MQDSGPKSEIDAPVPRKRFLESFHGQVTALAKSDLPRFLQQVGMWRATTLVIAALLAILLVWWLFGRGTLVSTILAKRGNAAQVVYATGTVEPVNWAKIATLQRKRIIEICTCEGQSVKKGEVLARLDDGEERAVLRELEARLARLKADAARMQQLVARSITSQTTYDEKRTQVREYEARVAAQMDRIADLALKSPMDGVVLRRDGEVGEIAGTGANEALLWVGQPKPLRVVAEVNEEDVGKIEPGQKVLLRHEGHTTGPLNAKVERLTPKGDPESKTFRVYLLLPDDTPLMIGMSVEANVIVREAKDAVLVPAEAIVDGTIQLSVDDQVVRRRVAVGIRGSRLVEIRDGVDAGDTVLSPFRKELPDGADIRRDQVDTP